MTVWSDIDAPFGLHLHVAVTRRASHDGRVRDEAFGGSLWHRAFVRQDRVSCGGNNQGGVNRNNNDDDNDPMAVAHHCARHMHDLTQAGATKDRRDTHDTPDRERP